MSIISEATKNPDIIKFIERELLQLFKASQFGFVYTLNVISIFFVSGVLLSLTLINSGDFLINIFNFLTKKFSIPDDYYHGSYSLKNFFCYSYLFATLVIYLIQKWWHRQFGNKLIIQIKHKIIAVPVVICLGYALVIYFFSQNYGFLSTTTLIFIILAIVTIIANYYYLLVSYAVKYLEAKII